MIHVYDGKSIDINVAQLVGDNQYPPGWFNDPIVRADAGIIDGVSVDPQFNPDMQRARELPPIEVDGIWTQQWEVLDLTPDEIRARRAATVPQSIEPLQGLLALDAAGLADDYERWATDPARTFAERAFINRAQVWRRDDPLLQSAIAGLGMTEAQGDDLFTWAATL